MRRFRRTISAKRLASFSSTAMMSRVAIAGGFAAGLQTEEEDPDGLPGPARLLRLKRSVWLQDSKLTRLLRLACHM